MAAESQGRAEEQAEDRRPIGLLAAASVCVAAAAGAAHAASVHMSAQLTGALLAWAAVAATACAGMGGVLVAAHRSSWLAGACVCVACAAVLLLSGAPLGVVASCWAVLTLLYLGILLLGGGSHVLEGAAFLLAVAACTAVLLDVHCRFAQLAGSGALR